MTSSSPKTYVLDASVLISSPYAIFAFDDNTVVVPQSVVTEMQKRVEGGTSDTRSNARTFGRLLDEMVHAGASLTSGVLLKNGGVLKVAPEYASALDACDEIASGAILVSRDPYQRIQANIRGIRAEEFKSEAVLLGEDGGYSGRIILYVPPEDMRHFNDTGELNVASGRRFYAKDPCSDQSMQEYSLTRNENVILANEMNPDHGHLFGRFNGHSIEKLKYYSGASVFGVKHRNIGQRFLLDALLAPASEIPLVIAAGPAGTGKTFLSLAAALSQVYDNPDCRAYKRIVLTRPNVKMDNDIGFLKGDELDKVLPQLRGVLDNIDNLMPDGKGTVDELISRQIIVPQSMAYMRGRSISNQYIIVDESQNLMPNQALSVITRAGTDTKLVLLGDPDQVDAPYLDRQTNGLVYAMDGMKGSRTACIIRFSDSECTRSDLAAEAIARLTPKGRK